MFRIFTAAKINKKTRLLLITCVIIVLSCAAAFTLSTSTQIKSRLERHKPLLYHLRQGLLLYIPPRLYSLTLVHTLFIEQFIFNSVLCAISSRVYLPLLSINTFHRFYAPKHRIRNEIAIVLHK